MLTFSLGLIHVNTLKLNTVVNCKEYPSISVTEVGIGHSYQSFYMFYNNCISNTCAKSPCDSYKGHVRDFYLLNNAKYIVIY